MSRLILKTRAELNDLQRDEFDSIARFRQPGTDGQFGGPFDVWLRSPEFAKRMVSFGTFIWNRTTLPRGLIELAIIVTARYWQSNVEWVAHARLALDNGIAQWVVDDVFAHRRPTNASSDELVVYDVAQALHETHELPRPVYDRAIAAFGEQGLVEIIATVGYYTTVSMTLNAFVVPTAPGQATPFPKRGT